MTDEPTFRFEAHYPLRHTDSFAGTPFVHGGVLLALTETALEAYDREAGVPSRGETLRVQSHSQIRYRTALRWDDAAIVRLRCIELSPGRAVFEARVEAASDGRVAAEFTHRFVYVETTTGQATIPDDWTAIVEAIGAYEDDVTIKSSP